jgi:hypothetical protein
MVAFNHSIPPQLACYIPIFFAIVCVVIVVGINTPESLAIVVPVMIIFGIVLVLGKYAEHDIYISKKYYSRLD